MWNCVKEKTNITVQLTGREGGVCVFVSSLCITFVWAYALNPPYSQTDMNSLWHRSTTTSTTSATGTTGTATVAIFTEKIATGDDTEMEAKVKVEAEAEAEIEDETATQSMQSCLSTVNQLTSTLCSGGGGGGGSRGGSRRALCGIQLRGGDAYARAIGDLRTLSAASLLLARLAAHPDKLSAQMPRFAPLPEGTFSILFVKPPWCKRGGVGEKGRLSIHDLTRLRLLEITAANAVLSMWSPLERIEDTILLGRLWGFRYVGVQFLCVRLVPKSHTPFLGASSRSWTRSNVEVVLLFSRGNPRDCVRDKTVSQLIFNCVNERGGAGADADADADTPSWQETVAHAFTTRKFEYTTQRGVDAAAALFFEPRVRATFKPAQLLATLERVYADLPRCVLFATEAHERWAVWGDLPTTPPPSSLLVTRTVKRERACHRGAASAYKQARPRGAGRSYAQYIAQKCELYEHQRAQELERAHERERRRKRSQKKSKARAARRTQTRDSGAGVGVGGAARPRSRSRSRERNP